MSIGRATIEFYNLPPSKELPVLINNGKIDPVCDAISIIEVVLTLKQLMEEKAMMVHVVENGLEGLNKVDRKLAGRLRELLLRTKNKALPIFCSLFQAREIVLAVDDRARNISKEATFFS